MKRILMPVVLTATVFLVMYFQAQTQVPVLCEPPDVHLPELPGFTSEEVPMAEAEREVLPADTKIIKRLYTGTDGRWAQVSVVIGGKSKSSVHRPELCLPAQGFLMLNPHTMRIGDVRWRVITLAMNTGERMGFAYTFFNQDGYHTSSHVERIFRDVWDRSFFNRIDRWVMVTVNLSGPTDLEISSFLAKLKEVVK